MALNTKNDDIGIVKTDSLEISAPIILVRPVNEGDSITFYLDICVPHEFDTTSAWMHDVIDATRLLRITMLAVAHT